MDTFIVKVLGVKNVNGMSHKGLKNDNFLGRVIMGKGMKVSIHMSIFKVNLIVKGFIKKFIQKDFKEWKGVVEFQFHGKLKWGEFG